MKAVGVLDVTLRDGGCVNDFNFGQEYMEKILVAQEEAGVEFIEMGYLDNRNGSICGRTQYVNEQVISEYILKNKLPGRKYLAMMDFGKFDVDTLQPRNKNGIDGIRLAFHKKNMNNIADIGKKIIEKGYLLFIQPMITLRYNDVELLELIKIVNSELPNAYGFYVVDSFGEMHQNDVNRIVGMIDNNLNPSIALGFHSHNNLQMSYSNAISLLQYPTNRNIILDCSIMGMGKGAGNLNTELLLEHLNLYYGKSYKVQPLLEVIDKVINQLHAEHYWGYAVEYYLSSINHCTPSYASHFYNKHMLPIDQVSELLGLIAEEKKISFDQEYAEKIYRAYNENKTIDDSTTLNELKKIFKGKKVLIIAPGKSINTSLEKITEISQLPDIITIGLNLTVRVNEDYVLITRKDIYDFCLKDNRKIITTSNISKGCRGNVKILDYKKWISIDEMGTHDSSSVIALNLLSACGVKCIFLAGFDGFSININDNYFEPTLRHPLTDEQAMIRNTYYKNLVAKLRNEGFSITFVTPSKYE